MAGPSPGILGPAVAHAPTAFAPGPVSGAASPGPVYAQNASPPAYSPPQAPFAGETAAEQIGGYNCSHPIVSFKNWAQLTCLNQNVTDSQILSSLEFSVVVGAIMLLGFVLLQLFIKSYRSRLYLPEVLVRPPPLATRGVKQLWAWAGAVLSVSDAELVRSAGLDALMFHRAYTFGVVFLAPTAAFACAVLIPLYMHGAAGAGKPVDKSFTQYTMGALPAGSPVLWVPFVYVYLVLAWGCWLLLRFYKEYVVLHQHYLVAGEETVNEWQVANITRRMTRIRQYSTPGATPTLASMKRAGARPVDVEGKAGSGADLSPQSSTEVLYHGGALGPQPISPHETVVGGDEESCPYPTKGSRLRKWWCPRAVMEPASGAAPARPLLGKPPVPFRKSVNTTAPNGRPVAVNAQQYVVLAYGIDAQDTPRSEVPIHRAYDTVARFWASLRLPATLALCLGPFGSGLDRVNIVSARTPHATEDAEVPPAVRAAPAKEIIGGRLRTGRPSVERAVPTALEAAYAGHIPGEHAPLANAAGTPAEGSQLAPAEANPAVGTTKSTAESAGPAGPAGPGTQTPDVEAGAEPRLGVTWRENDVAGCENSVAQLERFVTAGEELRNPPPHAAEPHRAAECVLHAELGPAPDAGPGPPASPGEERSARHAAPDSHEVAMSTHGLSFSSSMRRISSSSLGESLRRSGLGVALERPSGTKVYRGPLHVQSLLELSGPELSPAAGSPDLGGPKPDRGALGAGTNPPSAAKTAPEAPAGTPNGCAPADEAAAQTAAVAALPNGAAEAANRHGPAASASGPKGPVQPAQGPIGRRAENGPAASSSGEAHKDSPFARRSVQRPVFDNLQRPGRLSPESGAACGTAISHVSPQQSSSLRRTSLQSSHSLPSLMARHGGALLASKGADAAAEQPAALLSGRALVEAVFRRLFPDDFQQVVPVRNHKEVDLLLRKWDNKCRLLELAHDRFEASGFKRRPMHRPRCCGLRGEPLDSINTYAAAVRDLEEQVLSAQQRALATPDDTPAYFVIFRSQAAAAQAAQCTLFPEGTEGAFKVREAPGPEEVMWQTLWTSERQRSVSRLWALPYCLFFLLFPIGLFSGGVTNITNTICRTKALADSLFCRQTPYARGLITGLLPPILLSTWNNVVMPNAFYSGALLMRIPAASLGALDRRVFTLFFLYDFFNVFLGAVLGGSVLTVVTGVLGKLSNVTTVLGEALAKASNFFINYTIVNGFIYVPMRFLLPTLNPVMTLLRMIRLLPRPRGARAKLEAETPAFNIRMGRELGAQMMLILLFALAYAAVSPLILPFALWWFMGSWALWRYSLLYAFERCYESGGVIWRQVFIMIVWCLVIFAVFTGCVLITASGFIQGALLIVTTPPLLYSYSARMNRHFGDNRTEAPLLLAMAAPHATVDPAIYLPPALRPACAGWFPEYGKAWENYGAPLYYP